MIESFQDVFKKIPLASRNLGISGNERLISNYLANCLLVCIADPIFQKRLKKEPKELIEELSKL